MDINEINNRCKKMFSVEKKATEENTGYGFNSVFREIRERKLGNTDFPEKITCETTISENKALSESAHIVKDAERLLNILDEYRLKLRDTTVPLRDIAPLIDKLERERLSLTSALDRLPDGHLLRGIVDKTIEFSSQEISKFKRGEYYNVVSNIVVDV